MEQKPPLLPEERASLGIVSRPATDFGKLGFLCSLLPPSIILLFVILQPG